MNAHGAPPLGSDGAGFARRSGGWLVDVVIKAVATIAVVSSFGAIDPRVWVSLSLLVLVPFAMQWWYNAAGSSPGMRLCRLTIVSSSGTKPGWRRGLVRTVGALPSMLVLGLGYFWAAWDRDSATWHDRLAGTRVVSLGDLVREGDEVAAEPTSAGEAGAAALLGNDEVPRLSADTSRTPSIGQVLRWCLGAALLNAATFRAVAAQRGAVRYAAAIAGLVGVALLFGQLTPIVADGYESRPTPSLGPSRAVGWITGVAVLLLFVGIAVVPTLAGWAVGARVFRLASASHRLPGPAHSYASALGFALVPGLLVAIGLGPILRVGTWLIVAGWVLLATSAASRAIDGHRRMRTAAVASLTVATFVGVVTAVFVVYIIAVVVVTLALWFVGVIEGP